MNNVDIIQCHPISPCRLHTEAHDVPMLASYIVIGFQYRGVIIFVA